MGACACPWWQDVVLRPCVFTGTRLHLSICVHMHPCLCVHARMRVAMGGQGPCMSPAGWSSVLSVDEWEGIETRAAVLRAQRTDGTDGLVGTR